MISALIPARSGSKGVPGKNTRLFRGKPLIRHTIDAAIQSGIFHNITVSSDSDEILNYAKDVTQLKRDADLARDDSRMDAVIMDFIDKHNPECIMLLQPTSPLRTAGDIEAAYKAFTYGQVLISVNKADNNALKGFVQEGHFIRRIFDNQSDRRQDLPDFYQPNGAIYLFRKDAFINAGYAIPNTGIVPFLMHTSLDIDTEDDFR